MHRHNDFFRRHEQDDRRETRKMVFFLCYGSCFFDVTKGGIAPHNDSASTSSRGSGSASRCPPSSRRGSPKKFCRFFSVFFGLVAFFFFLSGWVGFPLPRFPPPPLFLWRFSSSGWVGSPCCVFPVFSPWFLGGWGGVFVFFSPAISCILHLSLLGPPPFSLVRLSSPVSCWESSGGRAEVKGGGVTGGFVTPHTS